MPVLKSIVCHCVDYKIAIMQQERQEPLRLFCHWSSAHGPTHGGMRSGVLEPAGTGRGPPLYLPLLTLLTLQSALLKADFKNLRSESLEVGILIFFFLILFLCHSNVV